MNNRRTHALFAEKAEYDRILSLTLNQHKFPCTIFAPSYLSQLKPYHGRNGHSILFEPMDLHRLSEFAFCIHHGGMGISSAGAIASIPQFVTPVNLEHALTASSLRKQEAAMMALPESVLAWQSSDGLCEAINACLNLPMKLHPEFNTVGSKAQLTLAEVRQQVMTFLH